jgi:hypothetical protein
MDDMFDEEYWEQFDKEKERQKLQVNPWNATWPFAGNPAGTLPGESSVAPDDDPTTGQ